MKKVGDKDDSKSRQNRRAGMNLVRKHSSKVILASSCASSALKIWIDSEDHFGTQSPKFQVQSTGVDDRYSSYKVCVTIYVFSPFISRRPHVSSCS